MRKHTLNSLCAVVLGMTPCMSYADNGYGPTMQFILENAGKVPGFPAACKNVLVDAFAGVAFEQANDVDARINTTYSDPPTKLWSVLVTYGHPGDLVQTVVTMTEGKKESCEGQVTTSITTTKPYSQVLADNSAAWTPFAAVGNATWSKNKGGIIRIDTPVGANGTEFCQTLFSRSTKKE